MNTKKHHSIIEFSVILFSIAILGILLYFYTNPKDKEDPFVSINVSETIETSAVDESLIASNPETYTFPASYTAEPILADGFDETASLNVPYISQYPELPTGCEITALAQVLSYYGYEINKEQLAQNYLPMKNVRTDGCFVQYFLGSPWSKNGSGCFAPAIATAANSFLADNSSSMTAESLSYSPVETLLKYVSDGKPVIVWTSFNYDNTAVTYREVTLDNGQTFQWPQNEHCVVLSGYDLNENNVTIVDPASGIVTHSLDEFTYFYQLYFYQAVVIH